MWIRPWACLLFSLGGSLGKPQAWPLFEVNGGVWRTCFIRPWWALISHWGDDTQLSPSRLKSWVLQADPGMRGQGSNGRAAGVTIPGIRQSPRHSAQGRVKPLAIPGGPSWGLATHREPQFLPPIVQGSSWPPLSNWLKRWSCGICSCFPALQSFSQSHCCFLSTLQLGTGARWPPHYQIHCQCFLLPPSKSISGSYEPPMAIVFHSWPPNGQRPSLLLSHDFLSHQPRLWFLCFLSCSNA